MTALLCGRVGCETPATEVLTFHGQAGHVHVCPADGAIDREWCAVRTSHRIVDGRCPMLWCTPEPIYTAPPEVLR